MNSNQNNHYITLSDGIDFRKIAKIMTDAGYVMNHATARNVLIIALRTLLNDVANQFGLKISEEKMNDMLRSQQLHDALFDVLTDVYNSEQYGEN